MKAPIDDITFTLCYGLLYAVLHGRHQKQGRHFGMSNGLPFVTIVAAGIATTEDVGKCVEEPAFMNHISMAATNAQHACTVPAILCHKQAKLSEGSTALGFPGKQSTVQNHRKAHLSSGSGAITVVFAMTSL